MALTYSLLLQIAANGRGYVNALQDGSSWEMEAQFDFSPGCNWLHLHYLCGCCNHEITFATTLLLWLLSLETLRIAMVFSLTSMNCYCICYVEHPLQDRFQVSNSRERKWPFPIMKWS